jgi:hypothetical protein
MVELRSTKMKTSNSIGTKFHFVILFSLRLMQSIRRSIHDFRDVLGLGLELVLAGAAFLLQRYQKNIFSGDIDLFCCRKNLTAFSSGSILLARGFSHFLNERLNLGQNKEQKGLYI